MFFQDSAQEASDGPPSCCSFPSYSHVPLHITCLQAKLEPLRGTTAISTPMFCHTYVLQPGVFHENDGNHDNDEDNSDSHEQGGECRTSRNHGNYASDENHGNPGCKTLV